jgi:hypothetical protein
MSAFTLEQGSFYNSEGVVYHQTVDRFIRAFPAQSIEDFKLRAECAEEFMKIFLGINDCRASMRICMDLTRRINEAGRAGPSFAMPQVEGNRRN